MERIEIHVGERTAGRPNDSRTEGMVPGVIYGGGRKEPAAFAVKDTDIARLVKKAGESTLINLHLGNDVSVVLLGEVQRHPVTDEIIHIDFRQVDLKKPVKAAVALRLIGESPAVKNLGGTLVLNAQQVHVRALPETLVDFISIDISQLTDFEKTIHIRDLVLPEGMEVLDDAAAAIALVMPPKSEEELKAEEAENAAVVEAEVIGAKKGEEGAETDKEESGDKKDVNKDEKKAVK
ncbi:MAG: 50S ribosomal protein L25 [Patescibacteria group bacterium]